MDNQSKMNHKNTFLGLLPLTILAVSLFSCSGNGDTIEAKQQQLGKLKEKHAELARDIKKLETEILAMDPKALDPTLSATLITTLPILEQPFNHFVEVRGNIESRSNVTVSSEMMGRVIRRRVKEGDRVSAGQVLMELDGSVLQSNMAELETSIDLAKTVYERQSNLWKQNIGTEIQYLQAKNNLESLERRLATLKAEMSKLVVRAPFSGSIEKLLVLEGEMLSPGSPVARLTGSTDIYLNAEVSEKFVGKFAPGDSVEVRLLSLGETIKSKISSVGSTINPNNRTFTVEVSLPNAPEAIKPNMLAVVTMRDYSNPQAIVIPAALILNDRIGTYVWALAEENGLKTASKRYVKPGQMSAQQIEILEGLSVGDVLVDKGFREMNEGMLVRISSN